MTGAAICVWIVALLGLVTDSGGDLDTGKVILALSSAAAFGYLADQLIRVWM